jgi:hypothetical protein
MASHLAAFALVASEYEKTGDAILGFAPLFTPLIADHPREIFDPKSFSVQFASRYGLSMTPVVAQALSERLAQAGLLVATRNNGETTYRCAEGLGNYQAVDESEVSNLVEEFVNRSKKILGELKRPIADDLLESAFLRRLARPEFTAAFLIPEKSRRNDRLLNLRSARTNISDWGDDQALDVLTADYILDLHEKQPQRFAALSAVTYGALVADAVSAFAVPQTKIGKEVSLRAVIDGPLLLDALDLNAPEHRDYVIGLLAQFKDAQIIIATFDHVVEEMRKTIRTTLDLFNRKEETYGPFAARLRVSPGHALYATYIADALEDELKRLGITIMRSALYDEARFSRFFPDSQLDSLRNSLGDVHYHLDRRITDARSVATVIRLKGDNRSPSSVLKSGTTFVTRNTALAKSVNKFLAIGRSEPDPRFVCLTDGQLAGVVWFTAGMSGSLLSQRRLIANCAATIAPRLEIVTEMSKTLGRMGDDRRKQFETLMQDRRAALCPMRMTAGYAAVISDELAIQTLAEMKAAVSEPLVAEAERIAAEKIAEIRAQEESARKALTDFTNRSKELEVALQRETGARREELQSSGLQMAELQLNAERAGDLARHAGDELKQNRERALRALRDQRSRIDAGKKRYINIAKNSLRVIFILALLFSLHPKIKGSAIVIYLLAFYTVVGFWLFTPWFEGLLVRFGDMLTSSRERQLSQMAMDLGFDGNDWQLQLAADTAVYE